jgi:hypothetical protein
VKLQVLPLAVTMMVGPQIISAIILVTTGRAVRVSCAFLAGIAVAATAGVSAALAVFTLIGTAVPLGDPGDHGSAGWIVQGVLVLLLVAAAVRAYLRRATSEPPAWLRTLLDAGPGRAFATGLLVVLLMPSDVVVMLTVGANLAQHGSGPGAATPFVLATVAVAALPLLALLLFRRRARKAMPVVREWLSSHSWVVTITTCAVFVLLII